MMMTKRRYGTATGLLLAAAVTMSLPSTGFGKPRPLGQSPSDQQSPANAPAKTLSGIVQFYNFDPHGHPNGLMLKTSDGMAQFNLPPDQASRLMAIASVGSTVTATGMPDPHAASPDIYRLTHLEGSGKKIDVLAPDDWDVIHVQGKIQHLNHSPRGDVDGMVLDNGDFVHVDPHSMKTLKPEARQSVSVDGWSRPMIDGHELIEATKVNGQRITHPRPPRHGPPPGGPRGEVGPGPHGPGGPGGPDAGPGGPPPPPPGGP